MSLTFKCPSIVNSYFIQSWFLTAHTFLSYHTCIFKKVTIMACPYTNFMPLSIYKSTYFLSTQSSLTFPIFTTANLLLTFLPALTKFCCLRHKLLRTETQTYLTYTLSFHIISLNADKYFLKVKTHFVLHLHKASHSQRPHADPQQK